MKLKAIFATIALIANCLTARAIYADDSDDMDTSASGSDSEPDAIWNQAGPSTAEPALDVEPVLGLPAGDTSSEAPDPES